MSLHVWMEVDGRKACIRCGTPLDAPADACVDHGHEWDYVSTDRGLPCIRCGGAFAVAGRPCPGPGAGEETGGEPASEIAALMAKAPAAPARELTAIQAVEQIRAWHEALRSISAVAEVRILEACWTIRRERPEREDFNALVGGHLDGILEPDRAWLMAETWDAARRSRRLREVAVREPDSAIAFVREFVDGGRAERLQSLDDEDHEVISILTDRPAQRRSRIRALIEGHQERLDLETDERAPETAAPPPPPPGPDLATVLGDFDVAVIELLRAGGALAGALEAGAPTRTQASRLVLLIDQAIGAMENASEAVERAEERLGEG